MKVSTILDQIDMGSLNLPQFQRGYVWSRPQVRNLMRSLYRDYPVGGLLIWDTQASDNLIRNLGNSAGSSQKLLLDGQQRITTLYGIIRGKKPRFYDGSQPPPFLNLYFNVATEDFEFYGPVKMKDDPKWVSITDLMQRGVWHFAGKYQDHPDRDIYGDRLNNIVNIKDREIPDETVTGADKTIDVVVDIFNEVNSGGTKLSKGDLALAKIGAEWLDARDEMNKSLKKWRNEGYYKFNLDWLLRCINAIVTGQSEFPFLVDVPFSEIQSGMQKAEKHIDTILNIVAARLGLDHHPVLRSPNSMPAMIAFIEKNGLPDHRQQSGMLSWYIHTILWGRYSGSVETNVRQDLLAVNENEDGVAALLQQMRGMRRDLRIYPDDLDDYTRGSRFYSLLYILTRVYGARDFGSGIELRHHMLGGHSSLQLHHVFPKALLNKSGYTSNADRNALANFTLLTRDTNLEISSRSPVDYFPYYESKHPGALESHWIPMDPELWKIENYRYFLAARRELLAQAANNFLDQLLQGELDEPAGVEYPLERQERPRPISIASDEEEAALNVAMDWMESKGLPRGEFGYELLDHNNELIATLDLAWPQGIQTGRGQAVALLIDEGDETLRIASSREFTCFTNVSELQEHVQHNILGE